MIKYLSFFLTTTSLLLLPTITCAQTYNPSNRRPAADSSQIGTIVNPTGANNFNIDGGLRRGQNLLHSFSDFSIPTGGSANFTNPAGNQSIITRVTGNSFSDINGLLNTNGANFLLINPHGVVFGTGVKLDVGRAFMASTASGINLVDGGGRVFAFGTNVNGDAPLLTVDSNVLFNPNQLIMGGGNGGISNFGRLQTANQGQYIGLIGGDVSFNGGLIVASGGRVDLGGLKSAGMVTTNDRGLAFSGNNLIRGDVMLTNSAIATGITNTLVPVNTWLNNVPTKGGSINVGANNLQITTNNNSRLPLPSGLYSGLVNNSGIQTLPDGDINIDAIGKVTLDRALIQNQIDLGAETKIPIRGQININSRELELKNNSQIGTNTEGKGNGGDININTRDNITVAGSETSGGPSYIMSNSYGDGNTGKISIDTQGKLLLNRRGSIQSAVTPNALGNSNGISIKAGELEIRNQSNVTSQTYGRGKAGDININVKGNLTVSGDDNLPDRISIISSNTLGAGNTGKISIDTQGKLLLDRGGKIQSGVAENAVGNSSGITIKATELELGNQSSINTTTLGMGNAGEIDLKIAGNFTIAGDNNEIALGSQIGSNSFGKGDAGKISIDTSGKLLLNRGGIGSAIAKNAVGNSNGITIKATELELKNGSLIGAQTFGTGNAGDINIITKGDLTISGTSMSNRSGILAASSEGEGSAGKISIATQGKLLINNSFIQSAANSGKGGNIEINISDLLLLRNDSYISTTSGISGGNGSGGNININSPLIVALPGDNDIRANAYQGNGGKVNITSQGLFGIEKRLIGSPFTNDITASSTFGQDGKVEISTPGTDPAKDKGELPAATNDASNQISQACGASQRDNKFYITGRGGLPPNAREPQESDALWEDTRAVKAKPATTASLPPKYAPPAIGLVLEPNGRARLIAAQTAVESTGTSVLCRK